MVLYPSSGAAALAHELEVMRSGGGIHVNLIPGSFRPVVNKDNDYMIDRAAQKHHKSYCGVKGIAMQDAAIQESCGPIQDRSKENLVSTDNGVIMARQRACARRRSRSCKARPRWPRSGDPCRALGGDRAGSAELLRAAGDALRAKRVAPRFGVRHKTLPAQPRSCRTVRRHLSSSDRAWRYSLVLPMAYRRNSGGTHN